MLSEEKAIIEVRKLRDANKRNSLGKSIDTVLNLIDRLQKGTEEKDKQIDLMAEFMIGGLEDIAFNAICKKSHCTYELKDNRPTNFRKCKLCIKQHFEKLAKEKGE